MYWHTKTREAETRFRWSGTAQREGGTGGDRRLPLRKNGGDAVTDYYIYCLEV